MELNKQCISLEVAKKLKELGIEQESVFWWHPYPKVLPNSGGMAVLDGYDLSYSDTGRTYGSKAKISAFTTAELGEMLWNIFEKDGWDLLYESYGNSFNFKGTKSIGELGIINLMRNPDMGGRMLISLLEHNLITNE